jgi:hypothetical protein
VPEESIALVLVGEAVVVDAKLRMAPALGVGALADGSAIVGGAEDGGASLHDARIGRRIKREESRRVLVISA